MLPPRSAARNVCCASSGGWGCGLIKAEPHPSSPHEAAHEQPAHVREALEVSRVDGSVGPSRRRGLSRRRGSDEGRRDRLLRHEVPHRLPVTATGGRSAGGSFFCRRAALAVGVHGRGGVHGGESKHLRRNAVMPSVDEQCHEGGAHARRQRGDVGNVRPWQLRRCSR